MLRAVGLSEADLALPQVGIASVWWEGNPCNMHLLALSEEVKAGVKEAGLVGLRFNTVGVSDGISMGKDGMSYSLQSREIIADSIETVVGAQWYDGLVTIPGCDKNMPGCVMAMSRLDRPAIMIYGGTIASGAGRDGGRLDIVSAFQSYGELIAGRIDDEERRYGWGTRARGPAPVVACTPPTPWRWPSRRWGSRGRGAPAPPRRRRRSVQSAGGWVWQWPGCSREISGRAGSWSGAPSTTPSPR
jgi:hypothetical protein